jgi:hypothetical protein
MNVRHQLVEICFLLADDGFVAVLEKVTDPIVPTVEILRMKVEMPSGTLFRKMCA